MIGGSFPEVAAPPAQAGGPLELLAGLHARTLQHCATLRRLVLYLSECGCDEQARRAAQAALDYFDAGPPRYFADEEEALFPALLESMAGSDPVCLRELTTGLAQQHRLLQATWAQLRKQVAAVAAGEAATLDSPQVEALVTLHHSHIERVRDELLPMAARLLTDEALEQLRVSMVERQPV